jgi:hypothetical protein
MTTDEVKARLRAAADTDRRMFVNGLYPAGFRSAWPDIAMSKADIYALGVEDAARPLVERMKVSMRRPTPSPREISDMDEVFGRWPLFIDDIKIRRCVMAWAYHWKWKDIALSASTSRRGAGRLVEHGIVTISLALRARKQA